MLIHHCLFRVCERLVCFGHSVSARTTMDRSARFVILVAAGIFVLTACFTSGSDIVAFKEDMEEDPGRQNANVSMYS